VWAVFELSSCFALPFAWKFRVQPLWLILGADLHLLLCFWLLILGWFVVIFVFGTLVPTGTSEAKDLSQSLGSVLKWLVPLYWYAWGLLGNLHFYCLAIANMLPCVILINVLLVSYDSVVHNLGDWLICYGTELNFIFYWYEMLYRLALISFLLPFWLLLAWWL
jgi:hypothetical protein